MYAIWLFSIFHLVQVSFAKSADMSIERLGDILSLDNLWIQSLFATLLVSIAPILVIFLIPDLKNHNNLLKVLLAFAAGGLLGDAFLHLIPHSIDPHDHTSGKKGHSHESHHGHSHNNEKDHDDHTKNMLVGLWVVAGIMTFLCVEKFVRLIKGEHSHNYSSNSAIITSNSDSTAFAHGESKDHDFELRFRQNSEKKISKIDEVVVDTSHNDNIKVSGYLNLVADFAHNFTDGLAIGAAFLLNKNVGIVTTITILFHELPHEIGDYAILIQSGCSQKKAMMLQLVTAIGALAGTVTSLISQDAGTTSTWILPFTAGGFIYISTVSVIPELLQEHTKLSQTISEIMAMIVGVGMMIVIAYFE